MKNVKIILGVAIIAALMTMTFASCGDPEPTDDVWTVTFNPGAGAEPVASQSVNDQGLAEKPYAFKAWTPQAAGFYSASQVATWKNGTKVWDFEKDKVTADITLTAEWANPQAISLTGLTPTSGKDLEKVVKYTNDQGDKFIWAINGNQESPAVVLDKAYADLRIVGIGGEQKIQLTGKGNLFTVGAASTTTTIALTVGSNVNLAGVTNNNKALVFVREGATFNLTGGKITGNTSDGTGYVSDSNNAGFGAAAVHVDAATFNFTSGEISGNTNAYATSGSKSAGAVYIEAKGSANLTGGEFKTNANNSGAGSENVYFTYSSAVKLGGALAAGEIGFGAVTDNTFGKITVDPSFTGTATINLAGAAGNWTNKTILIGATTGQQAKLTLGKYFPSKATIALKWDSGTPGKLVL